MGQYLERCCPILYTWRIEGRMMKKKVISGFAVIVLIMCLNSLCVSAEEGAVFQVKTGQIGADNTVRVSVCLTGVENLGGVEAQLLYNPEKVTYVESNLGSNFSDGYGETNCMEEESAVKCVSVYPKSKAADGELFYVVFRLKGGESYQPELVINELLDSSIDINTIPYQVTYQMADGTWADVPDISEKAASQEMQEENHKENIGENQGASENEKVKEEIAKQEQREKELEEIEEQKRERKETQNKPQKHSGSQGYLYIAAAAGIILVIVFLVWRKRK